MNEMNFMTAEELETPEDILNYQRIYNNASEQVIIDDKYLTLNIAYEYAMPLVDNFDTTAQTINSIRHIFEKPWMTDIHKQIMLEKLEKYFEKK